MLFDEVVTRFRLPPFRRSTLGSSISTTICMRFGIAGAFVALFLPLYCFGAQNSWPPALTGIVYVTDPELPALKLVTLRAGRAEQLLREGESDGECVVRSISPGEGSVALENRMTGEKIILALGNPPGKEMPGFELRGATFAMARYLLQMMAGGTVLAPTAIPYQRIDFVSPELHSRADAAKALEQALEKHDLAIVARGGKFILIGTTSDLPLLKSIPAPPETNAASEELFPPGFIKFNDADLLQFLDVYQDLTGRTVLRPQDIRYPTVSMQSYNPLSRAEVIWMMDTALRLNEIAMVNESDAFVFAVRPSLTNGLPHFDRLACLGKVVKASHAGLIKLTNTDSTQALSIYADILGCKWVETTRRAPSFSVRSQKQLDQAEAIYALEALAFVNGLQFEVSKSVQATLVQGRKNQSSP